MVTGADKPQQPKKTKPNKWQLAARCLRLSQKSKSWLAWDSTAKRMERSINTQGFRQPLLRKLPLHKVFRWMLAPHLPHPQFACGGKANRWLLYHMLPSCCNSNCAHCRTRKPQSLDEHNVQSSEPLPCNLPLLNL